MSTPIERQPSEIALLLQESKEAVQPVQDVVECRGGQAVVMGGFEPGVDIVRGDLCEVAIHSGLTGRGEKDAKGLDHPHGGLEGLGGIMPGGQEREVPGDEALMTRT
jgi:hypothetical protein